VEAWLAGLSTAAISVTALVGSTLVLPKSIEALKLLGCALVLAAIVLGAVSQPSKLRC
jgi:drug/metabolite transporter (DMT)-like permease